VRLTSRTRASIGTFTDRQIRRGRSAILSIVAAGISQYRNPDKNLDGQFCLGLGFVALTVVILGGFPLFIIFMASNGSIDILHLRYVAGWADLAAVACDISIPCFLVLFPCLLSRRLPWESASEKTRQVLLAWLVASASATTAVFIFALHFFKGGQLAELNSALVVAACLSTVALVRQPHLVL